MMIAKTPVSEPSRPVQTAPAASAPPTPAPPASAPAPAPAPAPAKPSSVALTPATPAGTQVSLPLFPEGADYTAVALVANEHQYLTAPREAVSGMPMDILVSASQLIELEAGVRIETTPEELRQQQEQPVRFSYQGQTAEGFRLALSNGQSYFLESKGDATFYPNDPALDILANTVEFRGGQVQDMRGMSDAEREAVLEGL